MPGAHAIRVRLHADSFTRHSHDTYTVVVTTEGVQEFFYRGSTHRSTAGEVVVLHPGEVHDGRSGTESAFAYIGLQLDSEVARRHLPTQWSGSLPFARNPVVRDERLVALTRLAASLPTDELLAEDLLTQLMATLCGFGFDGSTERTRKRGRNTRMDAAAQLLRASVTSPVSLRDLELATGLSASEVCRQFKQHLGTSPHRYLLMRRVEAAAQRIRAGGRLADIAAGTGFTDQPHMNRAFKAFLGLTPGAYAAMHARAQLPAHGNS